MTWIEFLQALLVFAIGGVVAWILISAIIRHRSRPDQSGLNLLPWRSASDPRERGTFRMPFPFFRRGGGASPRHNGMVDIIRVPRSFIVAGTSLLGLVLLIGYLVYGKQPWEWARKATHPYRRVAALPNPRLESKRPLMLSGKYYGRVPVWIWIERTGSIRQITLTPKGKVPSDIRLPKLVYYGTQQTNFQVRTSFQLLGIWVYPPDRQYLGY